MEHGLSLSKSVDVSKLFQIFPAGMISDLELSDMILAMISKSDEALIDLR